MKKGLKVVTIGGGSSYTPELVEGFIKRYSRLPIKELWLVDIEEGKHKLEIVGNLAKRMVEKANVDMDIHLSLNLDDALKDADFVTTQLRVGFLDARILDETIPIEFSVIGQETNGAGGMFKALRTIPVILSIIEKMRKLCPNAYLINFTNPAGIITQAAIDIGNWENTIGLCNVPIGMKMGFSNLIKEDSKDIDMEILGLNHHFFVTDIFIKGKSRLQDMIEIYTKTSFEDLVNMTNIMRHRFADEVLRGLNAIPCPYLSYYFFRRENLNKQLEELRKSDVRAQHVKEVEKRLFELYKDPNLKVKPKELEERGGAYYSEVACSLIDSIYNDTNDIQYVDTLNKGAISNMDDGHVVEIACRVGKSGPKPIKYGKAQEKFLGTIMNIKAFEQMCIEACVKKSRDVAIAALTMNPLVDSQEVAIKVFDKLYIAHKKYLGEYK